MAANLSAKNEKESDIIIIGEIHSSGFFNFFSENYAKLLVLMERGLPKKEVLDVGRRLERLIDYAIGLMGVELNLIKIYNDRKIITEQSGKKTRDTQKDLEDFLNLLKKYWSKRVRGRMEKFILLAYELTDVIEDSPSLEIIPVKEAVTKIVSGQKRFFFLREMPATVKLIIAAKKTLKQGKKVLVICGVEHASTYAKNLEKFGYSTSILSLRGEDKKELVPLIAWEMADIERRIKSAEIWLAKKRKKK